MRVRFWLPILASSVVASAAWARLGEGSTVSAKSSHYAKSEVVATSSSEKYTVVSVDENGLLLTEYVAAGGTVFAVKWHGQYQPDLADIFGKYYSEYEQEREQVKSQFKGTRSHSVHTSNVDVEISGHMGSMSGFAVVRSLVPRGVDVRQLR